MGRQTPESSLRPRLELSQKMETVHHSPNVVGCPIEKHPCQRTDQPKRDDIVTMMATSEIKQISKRFFLCHDGGTNK